MNILSIFDGISGAQVALQRAGIKVDKYYASEIDKYAIEITQKNYPQTIQLGSVNDWEKWSLPQIDLLIAGFPCQAWSLAGKQKGDNDPRGELVHRLIEVWKYFKPKYFLFENVKMKKEFLDYINKLFGVEPILINSALVSAQNRNRYYWTNIPNVKQPEDRAILLKDIVHDSSFEKAVEYIVPFDKTLKILDKEVKKGKVGYFRKDSQANRVYYIHGKSVTLCGDAGGGAAKMGQYLFGCITPDRLNKRQNGQRFNEGNKFYTLTAQDKHGVLINGHIRKLTPIECERLQTFPDNYTQYTSKTQRYKALGNSFTVDVIAHILKGILI